MNLIAREKCYMIVGLGMTGLSAARFLQKQGNYFYLVDTRQDAPNLEIIKTEFSEVPLNLGEIPEQWLQHVDEIVVSPGLPLDLPIFIKAREMGVTTVTDISLFAEHANAPVIAITGSNGKSTVTTLLAEMALANNLRVAVGGNIGVGALDLLNNDVDVYILELSSFQLDGVEQLNADVACVLNITPDHLDRYADMAAYRLSKHRVFKGAKSLVIHTSDPLTQPMLGDKATVVGYDLNKDSEFSQQLINGDEFLVLDGKPLLACRELCIKGEHNRLNALAALAIVKAAGWSIELALKALKRFKGLPHRCQWIAEKNGVSFINDSKATNTGSMIAAIKGLLKDYDKLLLIAGGVGKGQDFSVLKDYLTELQLKALIVFGQDAELIAQQSEAPVIKVADMQSALNAALRLAEPNQAVLLSPACASFDMYKSFEERGDDFIAKVEVMCA